MDVERTNFKSCHRYYVVLGLRINTYNLYSQAYLIYKLKHYLDI